MEQLVNFKCEIVFYFHYFELQNNRLELGIKRITATTRKEEEEVSFNSNCFSCNSLLALIKLEWTRRDQSIRVQIKSDSCYAKWTKAELKRFQARVSAKLWFVQQPPMQFIRLSLQSLVTIAKTRSHKEFQLKPSNSFNAIQ